MPVKLKSGESPIRANGKQLVIDGGFAEAYHEATGIAGYTLTFNSYGLLLTSHKPFISVRKASKKAWGWQENSKSSNRRLTGSASRTPTSAKSNSSSDLDMLICAYKRGIIKERNSEQENLKSGFSQNDTAEKKSVSSILDPPFSMNSFIRCDPYLQ